MDDNVSLSLSLYIYIYIYIRKNNGNKPTICKHGIWRNKIFTGCMHLYMNFIFQHLTLIVFVIEGRWPYNWCFVGCCLQDLFKTARRILVWLPSSFFSSRLVSVHEVHPYSSIENGLPPHMAEQKQDDQLEPTYSSSVVIRDVALRTSQKWWTMGRSGVRGSC